MVPLWKTINKSINWIFFSEYLNLWEALKVQTAKSLRLLRRRLDLVDTKNVNEIVLDHSTTPSTISVPSMSMISFGYCGVDG